MNSINDLKLEVDKLLNVNLMKDFGFPMSSQSISIPGFESKSWTISKSPRSAAKIKGVK